MSKITSIAGQESVNRNAEPLGSIWSINSTKNNSPKKQGPFMFSGEGSDIYSHIVKVIESSSDPIFNR